MDKTLIAYLAGYFDGEGCVGMRRQSRGGRFHISVAVTTGCRPALNLFAENFGGRVSPVKRRHNRQLYTWCVAGRENTARFLFAIQPYSIEKRLQIDAALEWLCYQPPCYLRREADDYDKETGERYFELLRDLKLTQETRY